MMVWDGRYHQYVRESTLFELRARRRDREAFKGGWVAVDIIYVVQFSLVWFDEKGLDVESDGIGTKRGLKSGKKVVSGREGEKNAGGCKGRCLDREVSCIHTFVQPRS